MFKDFLKQGVWYTFSTILSKAILFITIPILTFNLTKTEFAVVDSILIYSSIIPIIFSLESYQAFARFYPDCVSNEEINELFTNNLFFVIFSGIILFLILTLFNDVFKSILGINFADQLLTTSVILLMLTNYIFYVISEQLRWMSQFKSVIYLNLFYSFSYTLFIILGLYVLKGGFRYFIFASCFASAISILLGLFLSRKYFTKKINIKLIQRMLRFSTPLVGATLCLNLIASLDRLMVKYMLGNDSLAILSFGNRITVLVSLVIVSLQQPLAPLILNSYENSRSRAQYSSILKHFSFFLFSILLFVALFSDLLVTKIAPKEYWQSSYLIPVLCLKAVFSQTNIYSLGLSIGKKSTHFMILSFAYLFLSFIFQFVLFNFFGIYGIVYGSFFASFIYFLTYIFLSNKYFKVEINYQKNLLLLLILAIIFLFSIEFFYLNEINITNISFRILEFFTIIIITFKLFYSLYDQKIVYNYFANFRNTFSR